MIPPAGPAVAARPLLPARLASQPLAAALLLALACLALHGRALDNGWQFDDPGVLAFVTRFSPWQYFTQLEVMRYQSHAFITPWGTFGYEIGLALFGLQPRGHYGLLLLVLWGSAFVTWRLLRATVGGPLALTAAVLFLAMPGTAAIAQTLMTVHYAYGLLFTLLAIAAWRRALRQDSLPWAMASATLYALACLCKELYVPLPLVLALWPAAPWRLRLRRLAPVLMVALGYTLLRLWVLGGIGGYAVAAAVGGPGLQHGWAALPWVLAGLRRLVVGPGWTGLLALLTIALLLLVPWRRRLPPGLTLGAAAMLLVPVLPMLLLTDFPYGVERLGLALGWTLAVLVVLRARQRPAMAWLLLPLVVLQVLGQQQVVERLRATHPPSAAENAFLARPGAGQFLLPHAFVQVGYRELMRQAAARVNGQPSAEVLPDIEALMALGPAQGRTVMAWRDDCRCLRPLGEDYERRVQDHQRRLQAGAGRPLQVQLAIERQGRYRLFRWHIEGSEGRPVFDIRRVGRLALPRAGVLPFVPDAMTPLTDPAQLRVGLETPDGALIRTPLLALPLDGGSVSWSATATQPAPAASASVAR